MRRYIAFALAALVSGWCLTACSEERATNGGPVFDTDVAPILQARCVACHGDRDASPAAEWSATSYLGAIGCVAPSSEPATLPSNHSAPILTALATAPHVGILDGAEKATLEAWVANGTPAFVGSVHDPGIVDPRSAAFHGTVLRQKHWSQMLDPNDPASCGQCHDGTPTRPSAVTSGAPAATACTTCHDQPLGALACSTCHGTGTQSAPPRDPCFFPADATHAGAHAAHVNPSDARSVGLPCSTCHPTPSSAPSPEIGGFHGDGIVDVALGSNLVGSDAGFDPTSLGCAVSCHNAGGRRPKPAWSETTAMGCNDCHLSPPANHFAGACTTCHAEANSTGTALSGGPLHLNGKVDLGDGSGLCGACHGTGSNPWPKTAAHPAHENPSIASPLACSNCHVVPQTILDPTHLNGVVEVTFGQLADARRALPVWNGTSCSEVACHGANLPDPSATPAWTDTSGAASACGACHGIPPRDHSSTTSCGASACHGSEVGMSAGGIPFITDAGLTLHVDGVFDFAH